MTTFYTIAGLHILIDSPQGINPIKLMPSLQPFSIEKCDDEIMRFSFSFRQAQNWGGTLCCDADMGFANTQLYDCADAYIFKVITSGNHCHIMRASKDFITIDSYLDPDDIHIQSALQSMLLVSFSQAALLHSTTILHASAVTIDNAGYVFLGRSGAGKSTHAEQWLDKWKSCVLLNDDNPAVSMRDGIAIVYGTPWSGKTMCYKNILAPLKGIAKVEKSDCNRFELLSPSQAFATILPSCSAIHADKNIQESLYGIVANLSKSIPTGIIECLPNTQAAEICHQALAQAIIAQK